MTEDGAAEAAWKTLVQAVTDEMASEQDNTWMQYHALLTVRELLFGHHPAPDESHSIGLWCIECWDTWPCAVYQVIEKGMRRGE